MPATTRMRQILLLPLVLGALLLASFALAGPASARMSRLEKVHTGLDIVRHQKGDPYRYGAAGPNAFDCSGLVYYSYRKAGFRHVPRTSSGQARWANRIHRKRLRPGDLIFFTGSGGVYHVGVYAGRHNGSRYIVHAPYSGTRVHRERIWTHHWFAGTLRYGR